MRCWWGSARSRALSWLPSLGENGPRERERERAFYEVIDPLIATVTADLEPWEAYDAAFAITEETGKWFGRVRIASDIWDLWMNFADCFEAPPSRGMPDGSRVRDGAAMVAQEWLTIAPEDRRAFLEALEANSAWWDWLVHAVVAPAPPIDKRRTGRA